ncbi:secreted RxLR effector protein 161-like [Solanum verrucosum]|uniref:secreted RxLR effector protein 161-like n=1 Tax=Solanum verrucosum TaxID=315347 RepID=UPI0020D0120E|nr:secreted RxLR effector protein 161-like [Solanum verrucosum]
MYMKEFLKKFKLLKAKVLDIPMSTSVKFDLDEDGVEVNQTMYRGIIGSLLYITASKPDIVFSVGMCARFQAVPNESHLKAAKRILRYLKGTQDLVLIYPTGDSLNLIVYVDADYAGFLADRKSTSGMTHLLGSSLISWGTKKQNSVALSSTEAEYVADASCCAQLIWIKQQLEYFGVLIDIIPLICDNTRAMNMAKNPVQHKRTNHIDVRHHFLRDNIEKQNVVMSFCKTEDQLADIFTKSLE